MIDNIHNKEGDLKLIIFFIKNIEETKIQYNKNKKKILINWFIEDIDLMKLKNLNSNNNEQEELILIKINSFFLKKKIFIK